MAISASSLITELLPALNAGSTSDLTWWTTSELYQYADELLKRLARTAAVFVDYDSITAGSGAIDNPSGALVIIHMAANGATLRPAAENELLALDPAWESTAGTPKRWIQTELQSTRLYPAPSGTVTLTRIFHANPPTVASGTPTITAPPPIGSYVLWGMLGRARAKEGEAMLPDVAGHATERVGLWEKVFTAYWGATS
jgi:hypothetical protein